MKFLLGASTIALIGGMFLYGLLSNTGRMASPEQYAHTFASVLPFGYAFAAGMVASVNPCGFLMLPAFVGYQVGTEAPGGELTAGQLGRGALMGATTTLGFLTLFTAIGLVVAGGGHVLIATFPWAGLLIGLGLAGMGLWLLVTGRSLGLTWASRASSPGGRGLLAVFLYGLAYGAVSLSCTLPVFLVVVATSLTNASFLHSLGQFVSYALGMGAVITAVTMAATAVRGAFAHKLQGIFPYLHRLSALFLLGAGAYLVVYWVWLGRVFA